MPDDTIPNTFVRPDNNAVVTCPHCNRQKAILADSFKVIKHKLKVKCVCQKVFIVILEFRNKLRKKTRLRGRYINNSQNKRIGSFSILDISVTGLGFNSQDATNLKLGDTLTVEFCLDDERKTVIYKDVIVRYINQDAVGCEFEEAEEPFGSPLGRYIMSD